jgi:hypothetical protein
VANLIHASTFIFVIERGSKGKVGDKKARATNDEEITQAKDNMKRKRKITHRSCSIQRASLSCDQATVPW